MHTKDDCSSSSSQSGFGRLVLASNMHTNADAFTSFGTGHDSNVIQQRQDLVNSLSTCLSGLVETSNEVEAMQEKIGKLRGVMRELHNNLNLILHQASLENNRFGGGGGSSFQTLLNSFGGLNLDAAQRGGQREEEPLVMPLHNQGLFKTELCTKWQETGTCTYGKNCQYAHGIGELRPVMRQPCRLVLAGLVCPFGHLCHFRHELTEEEKALPPIK